MERWLARLGTLALAAGISTAALGGAAQAGPTATGTLRCGSESYTVSGYGRGTPLHLVNDTSMYVVTHAERGGTVLIDVPGQRNRADLVTCTTINPLTGTAFVFNGFFTPR